MARERNTGRREFLNKAAATSGIVGLTAAAGCLGDDADGDDDDDGREADEELGEQLPEYTFLNNAQSYNPPRHDAVNLIADQFENLGFDMEVEVLEWGTLFNRVSVEYDYDFSLWHTFFTIDPVLELNSTMYSENTSPGDGNFAGYENPDADDLMDQYLVEPDADRRIELVHDLQRLLMDDLPQMPAIDMPFLAVFNNEKVTNWEPDLPLGYNSYWTMINLEMLDGEDTLVGYWPEALDTMNPLGHNDENKHTYTFDIMYDSVVRLDNEGEINTDVSLATDFERVDETTMEYTIRDHTFHDGEPLTVEDVAFSYNYITENEVPVYSVQANFIDEAEVVDDETVRIHMPEDNPLGPFNLLIGTQLPILPEHIWADIDEPSQASFDEPVGSGPLQFNYWDRGAELGLERFDDHFATVDFEERIWRIIPEASTVWEGLREGDITYETFGRIDRQLDENRDLDQITVLTDPATSYWHCTPNQRTEGLDDPEVRKAAFNAIPRTPIVDQILFGVPEPGFNVVSEAFGPLHTDDVTRYEEGVDVGIERLRDAGYVFDEDGMVHFPPE